MSNRSERTERGTAGIERKSSRINHATAWVAGVGAFFTLIAAGLTVWGVVQTTNVGNLNEQVAGLELIKDELQRDLDLANSRVESRNETIAELREENRELRLYAPPQIEVEDEHEIRNAASLELAEGGDTVKLHSALPNFEVGPREYISGELRYTDGLLRLEYGSGAASATLRDDVANYATCAIVTTFQPASAFDPHDLQAGDVCIRLDSGRYAAIVVTAYDASFVDLQITVWE